jgi:hypothetical protein
MYPVPLSERGRTQYRAVESAYAGLRTRRPLDPPRRFYDELREALARIFRETGDRAAYAHGRPEPAVLTEDRRAHAGNASFPLGDALGPTPDPDSPELWRIRPVVDAARREGEQYLARRPTRERHDGAHGHGIPQTRRPLHGRHTHPVISRDRSTSPTPAALFPHPSNLNPSTYRPSCLDTR